MRFLAPKLVVALLFVLWNSSCKKDFELFIPQAPETEAPGAWRHGDVAGRVRHEEGHALAQAELRLPDGTRAHTDAEGLFRLREVAFTERYFPLQVQHPEALPATVFLGSSVQGLALAEVVLLGAEAVVPFHTSDGLSASLPRAELSLPAAALVTTDGAVFSGQAQLRYAAWTEGEPLAAWPLPLARTSQGLQFVLPAGMWALFATQADGRPLRLRSGFAMQVQLSPNEARPFALHDGLTLWHFDEATGLWEAAAIAMRKGQRLVAELPAVGYWMVGQLRPATWIAGHLQTAEGVALPQMELEVALPDGLALTRLPTQTDGSFVAYVPGGEGLSLRCTDLCGQLRYQTTVGPLHTPTRLAPFTAAPPSTRYLQGRLRNCAGMPQGAALRVAGPEQLVFLQADPDGRFGGFAPACQSPWVVVQAVDPATGRHSVPRVWQWQQEKALPPLSLCLDQDSWAFVALDEMDEQLSSWSIASDDGSWRLSGLAVSGAPYSLRAGMVTHAGTYDLKGQQATLGTLGTATVREGQLVIRAWSAAPGGLVAGYWWALLEVHAKTYRYTGAFRTYR